MSRPVKTSAGAEERAHEVLRESKDAEAMREAQAFLLPLAGLSLNQTALLLGRDRFWVSRARNRFIRGETPQKYGGRRRSLVAEDQEIKLVKRAFLDPDPTGPRQGTSSLRTNLRTLLEQSTGSKPAESTITLMLDRVAPKLIDGACGTDLQRVHFWLQRIFEYEQALCKKNGTPWP